MTYKEATAYIDSLSVFGSKPGLERITALMKRLGNPEKKLKFIHVAGTNGKGSVCEELSCILTKAGFNVGLFSSPHVVDFRERFRVRGEYISKKELASLCLRVKEAADALADNGLCPTEFELLTAIAFLFFYEKSCEPVVLETGLGGLLDSTNIIGTPLVSVISQISEDHIEVLGKSLAEIALQKAGIIKQNGVTVIAPDCSEEVFRILRTSALDKKNSFVPASTASLKLLSSSLSGQELEIEGRRLFLRLAGAHQLENLALSLETVKQLRLQGFKISSDDIKNGLEAVSLPARTELLSREPLIILDGGHNKAGAKALCSLLSEFVCGKKKITLLVGLMADKDVEGILRSFSLVSDSFTAASAGTPRALSAARLAEKAKPFFKEVHFSQKPSDALSLALSLLSKDDCLVICGSLYLAGELRDSVKKMLPEAP